MPFYPLEVWEALRSAYVSGKGSIATLATKHGVVVKTAAQRASKEHWTDLRRQKGEAALAALVPNAAPQPAQPTIPPTSAEALEKKLHRLELQLARVDDLLDRENDARELERLTGAKARLADIWFRLAGVPLPGSRRHVPEREGKRYLRYTGPLPGMPAPVSVDGNTQT